MTESKNLKCRGCGQTTDVQMHQVYIGGQGNVWYPYCTDMVSCALRMNKQMGLPKDFDLEKVK